MATLGTTNPTLLDWAKRLDGDGKIGSIVELLTQTNEILDDAVFIEGNLPTGHRVIVRTGLPIVYWRALNQGVPSSKSTTVQVDETIGMLEAYSEIDVKLAKLNGNSDAFRLSEDSAFIEAMNQTQAETMFYGNPATDAKQYLGLASRYSDLDAVNGANIIDALGVGSDNTSIWLVVWGENTVFCTFPKGSQAGLQHEDLGEVTKVDADGKMFQALRSHYMWDNGLVVKDWRYVVRIANIDVSALLAGTGANVLNLMSQALDLVPNLGMGRAVFYMNRTVYSRLRIQAMTATANVLAIEKGLSQFGTPRAWGTFMGVPFRKVDQLLSTEAAVS